MLRGAALTALFLHKLILIRGCENNIQHCRNDERFLKFAEKPYAFVVKVRPKKHHDAIYNGPHCGGTLISPKCVLSAAHCVVKFKPADLLVSSITSAYRRGIKTILYPRQFDIKPRDQDISVLVLNATYKWDEVTIGEMDYHRHLTPGDDILTLGWRESTSTIPELDGTLKVLKSTVIEMDKCQKYRTTMITENMFCAYYERESRTGIGDSGGPALHRGKIVGIVSFGAHPIFAAEPVVYTSLSGRNVAKFLSYVMDFYCR